MSKATITVEAVEVAPLSEHRGDWRSFLAQCSYAGEDGLATGRQMQRYEGDRQLLERLLGDDGCIADMTDDMLLNTVEDLEAALSGRWQLVGDETQPIRERLDRHFIRRQRAWLEQQRERDELLARQARERAESRVMALRADILTMRGLVDDLHARIAQTEDQLVSEAEQLGLEAWPTA